MKFSNEMIEKAKTAKSAEELLEMAKAENIELSEEQAAKAFAELKKSGELSTWFHFSLLPPAGLFCCLSVADLQQRE